MSEGDIIHMVEFLIYNLIYCLLIASCEQILNIVYALLLTLAFLRSC